MTSGCPKRRSHSSGDENTTHSSIIARGQPKDSFIIPLQLLLSSRGLSKNLATWKEQGRRTTYPMLSFPGSGTIYLSKDGSILMSGKDALPFSAPTARRGSVVPLIDAERCLPSPLQRDDRQVPAATMELDFKLHLRPGTATHECPRLGARRASRPAVPWLIAQAAVGRIVHCQLVSGGLSCVLKRLPENGD